MGGALHVGGGGAVQCCARKQELVWCYAQDPHTSRGPLKLEARRRSLGHEAPTLIAIDSRRPSNATKKIAHLRDAHKAMQPSTKQATVGKTQRPGMGVVSSR